ncbi:MAG: TonB-dependent receptor [Pseudomonadota bacterium]
MSGQNHPSKRHTAFSRPTIIAVVTGLTAMPAIAEINGPIDIDIAAQGLQQALEEVSEAFELSVLASGDVLQGRQAPAVRGSMTSDEAVRRLLTGSGLAASRSQSGAIMVRAAAAEVTSSDASNESTNGNRRVIDEILVRGYPSEFRVSNASSATLFDRSLDETPFNIGVITEGLVDGLQLDTLEESVLLNASVQRSHLHNSNAAGFAIRGFGVNADDSGFLVNGVPVSSGEAPPAHTSALERIEVLKGAAALYYGAGDPAGVINYIYKEPLQESRYNVSATVGNFGEYRAELDATGTLAGNDSLLYRFTLGWEDSEGFADFDYSRDLAPTLQLLWRPTEQTDVRLIAEYVQHEGNPIIATTFYQDGGYIEFPDDHYLGFTTDYDEQDSTGIQLHVDHRFSDTLQLKVQAGYKDSGRETGNSGYLFALPFVIPGLSDPANGLLFRAAFDQKRESEAEYAGAHIAWDVETGGISHQLVAGINYSRINMLNIGFFNAITNQLGALFSGNLAVLATLPPSVNIFDPVPVAYDHRTNFYDSPPFGLDRWEFDNVGLNLQDAIDIPALNLHLLIGARYGSFGIRDLATRGFDGTEGAFFNTVDESRWIPRVGAVYDINDNHNVYVSYGESFKAPFTSARDPNGNAIDTPETGNQVEIGWRGEWLDGALSTTVAAYELTKEDIIVASGIPNVSFVSGEQTARGLELDVTGKLTDGWDMYLSYAYTDTEIVDAGTSSQDVGARFTAAPLHRAVLWNNFTLDWTGIDGLRVGYGLDYQSETLVGNVDAVSLSFANVLAPAQGVIHNANVTYTRPFGDREFSLNLGIKNVTDRFYVRNTALTIAALRGDPRTFLLTASMTFN